MCCSLLFVLSACSGHEETGSGYVGTAVMNQDQITQLISQQGYTAIADLHKNGDDWLGAATKEGKSVSFDIDKNGAIHTK